MSGLINKLWVQVLTRSSDLSLAIQKGWFLMSQYNLPSVYQFLLHTPEQGLRKILIDPKDPKSLTDIHFSLLIKIIRNCPETIFCDHFDKGTFPKIKFSPNETKIKEKFWTDLTQTLNQRGLLSPAEKAAA